MTDDDTWTCEQCGRSPPAVSRPDSSAEFDKQLCRVCLVHRRRVHDGDAVDPEDPRPAGHYPRFADNEWHYVPDELAQTISLGPAGDGEEGQDWVLTYTPERRDRDDREKVLVRLTPRALHELYIETKDLSNDDRMHGHSAECDLCGEQVDLERAIPDRNGKPTHRHCWAEANGAPEWFTDYA